MKLTGLSSLRGRDDPGRRRPAGPGRLALLPLPAGQRLGPRRRARRRDLHRQLQLPLLGRPVLLRVAGAAAAADGDDGAGRARSRRRERRCASGRCRSCWRSLAIVVTHHLTSYATGRLPRRAWRSPTGSCTATGARPTPGRFAVLAAPRCAGFWLLVVASSTFGYLTPPLSDAFEAIGNTLGGEAPPRGLFQGSGTGDRADAAGRAGGGAAGRRCCSPSALPFGLREIWRRYRDAAVRAALRDRRARLLRHPGAAPGAARPGRPATGPASSSSSASPSSLAGVGLRGAGGRWPRRWRPRPAHRRRSASSWSAARSRAGPGTSQLAQTDAGRRRRRARSPRRRWRWPNGPSEQVQGGASPPRSPMPGCCWSRAARSPWPAARPTSKTCSKNELAGRLGGAAAARKQAALRRRRPARSRADGIRGYYFTTDGAGIDEELLPESVGDQVRRASPARARIYTNGPITVFDLEGGR